MQIPRWLASALLLACVLLLVAGSVLLKRNRALADQNEKLQPGHWEAIVGAQIPSLAGFDSNGDHLTVPFGRDGSETVFFIYSTGCPACSANWMHWNEIVQWAAAKPLRFVAICSTSNFFNVPRSALGLPPNIISFTSNTLDPAAIRTLRPYWVPETVLVSAAGRVQWAHSGELGAADLKVLEQLAIAHK